jgi:hypothetical protein
MDTYECKYPCPYESGVNKYVYLDGLIFGDERLKLGLGNLVIKHEVRSSDAFLQFVDYQSIYNIKSKYVGKIMRRVFYRV